MNEKVLSEDQEQMLFVQWFKRTYPEIRLMSIPNGGHRHIAIAAKMKATGQSKGVPDIYIPALRLWIEMKKIKGGVTSQDQKDWIAYLQYIGDTAVVCKGFEAAKNFVLNFKKP